MVKSKELETIINFNEAEDEAAIYTTNRKLKNKIEAMGYEAEEEDDLGGKTYNLPKDHIQLRKPRDFTDEQKAEGAERLKLAREALKKVGGKSKPKVVEEDDDEEDEAPAPKKVLKKPSKPVVEDDEDEDEEPARPAKKAAKKAVVEDDDDDGEDEDDEPVRKPSKKHVVEEDDDDEDEPVEVVKRKVKK